MTELKGKKVFQTALNGKSRINDLTMVDTLLEPPADEEQKSEAKRSKISKVVD